MNPGPSAALSSGCGKLKGDELFESLQVLGVQFNVVVTGALHPQRLDGAGAALVHGQAVGEVDDLVFRTVDHQHWGRHLGHLVNAVKQKETEGYGVNWKAVVTENRPVRERGEEPDGMFPRQHSQSGEEAVSNPPDIAGQAERGRAEMSSRRLPQRTCQAASMSAYRFFSEGLPVLTP
ncbi:hypothetical protein EYF80_014181 [Liparis tanakae]|uniref:Uncharacterized protein n=1 Tax=Liparis tanakae TaxID=230148 RepID=A0A4Z2ID28_9TELE|nr:hypothetical protein EYF80_014181 [Liparis tanakae]